MGDPTKPAARRGHLQVHPSTNDVLPAVIGEASALVLGREDDFRTVDADRDDRFEALEIDVAVGIRMPGDYVASGRLERHGTIVANRAASDSSLTVRADVSGAPGRHIATLRFSDERIRRSQLNGPLKLVANDDNRRWPLGHRRASGLEHPATTSQSNHAASDAVAYFKAGTAAGSFGGYRCSPR